MSEPRDLPPRGLPLSRQTAEQLLDHRVLLLDTPLEEENGSQIIAQLVLLPGLDPHTDISLWINSPGGSVPSMLAVADAIDLVPNDVATVAWGMADGAGQLLLCCGTPGKRFVLPHARVLLHQGSAGIRGSAADVELQPDDLLDVRDTVLAIIAERTGQSEEQVFADSLRDHVFGAEGAVAYGFADHVVTDLAQIRPLPRRAAGLAARAATSGGSVTTGAFGPSVLLLAAGEPGAARCCRTPGCCCISPPGRGGAPSQT